MINKLYTLLTNRLASDLVSLPFHDIVAADFQPIVRHSAIQEIYDLAFTADLQHSQRLINTARLVIQRGPLARWITSPVSGGLDIQEIEGKYLDRNIPTTDTGARLGFSGRLRSEFYRLIRMNVAKSGPTLSIVDNSGQLYLCKVTAADAGFIIVFESDSCGMQLPANQVPTGISWAALPDNMLASMFANKDVIANLLLQSYDSVDFTLDSSTVLELVKSITGECSFYALAVIGMLVASHTAKMAGIDSL